MEESLSNAGAGKLPLFIKLYLELTIKREMNIFMNRKS